jgi:hypothetical protein
MDGSISHHSDEETPLAKARWFQSLSVEQRMELLCAWTNLILENNPNIADQKDARSTSGRVQVLARP